MLTGCIQLDPYQKYHTALNSDQCVPDINTTYTETVYEPALSENTAEYTISESGFGTDNDDIAFDDTASRPAVEVTAINAIPEMTSEDILPISVELEERQFYALETTSSNYSDVQISTGKISSTLGREEALYVQVFATLDEDNAKNVLRDVRSFFPEQTSVIRSAGIYRILIGPLEKDETTFVVNEINKQSDYSTAFVLSHFIDISDDEI
ncbi:hypothetical protein C9I99_13175 [Photobacterium lutimaris]|uniref:SPOR domain-containing protein n=2 Tax=Photobacterium lutimaris TaxID=388278 RepID=A0A2T3IYP3_9GAMM|nr:hypothetical protein C9I99_13175 [Photobacterium lutimaris]